MVVTLTDRPNHMCSARADSWYAGCQLICRVAATRVQTNPDVGLPGVGVTVVTWCGRFRRVCSDTACTCQVSSACCHLLVATANRVQLWGPTINQQLTVQSTCAQASVWSDHPSCDSVAHFVDRDRIEHHIIACPHISANVTHRPRAHRLLGCSEGVIVC